MAYTLGPTTQLTQNVDNLKASVQGAISNAQNSAVSGQAGQYPWQDVNSRFWHFIAIKPDRWDQLFPYRFLVIDTKKGNQVVNGSSTTKVTVKGGNNNAIVNFEPLGRQWIFTLPITPEQLSITDQYAINTTATIRGVMEEHAGLKFKLIAASGTMGVWPYRQSVTSPPASPSLVQSLFGGILENVGNVVNQFNSVINTATSGHPANKPARKGPETSQAGPQSTGYYAALALQQFLEQYAEAKRNPANSGWRLVFDIPKQNQSFVVTPLPFVWQQNAQKPLHINYQLQLKAWRRIDLQEKISPTKPDIQPISPGVLQRILNTITEARKLTSAAVDLIGAVRSDVEKPLDVLRQSSLFVKDLAGAVISAADLPFQIQRDYASSIKESLNILSNSIASISSDDGMRSALSGIQASSANVEGLSLKAVAGGQIGNTAAQAQSIDPADNVFRQPERNFPLMDSAPVFSLSLNNAQQAQVDETIEEARQITVDDLKQFRATIQTLALQLSNNFGAGSEFYSQVYNLPAPTPRLSPMTLDEYEILKSLYDVMQSYDILTATTEVDDLQKQTNMDYVAGLADGAEIAFNVPTSKILAPVPFGLTIEAIAARYLQDPQRWLEIVTLNNLQDPYIDENGFQRPLLSNATGRQITIGSIENMYIGQRVLLRSTTQPQSARTILGIDRLSDTSYLLSLDGAPNLDNFIIADKAYLQAYLPGTVNSQQKIFIPSDLPVPNGPNIIVPTSVAGDTLVGLSKVDWLLTDRGDIAVNSFADFRLSAGITNLIQAMKLKIATPKGTVLVHPDFGLGIKPGIMNSEVDIQDIYNSLAKMIEEDPRFQGLDSLQISIDGPKLSISMSVAIAGGQGVFPLTFELAA